MEYLSAAVVNVTYSFIDKALIWFFSQSSDFLLKPHQKIEINHSAAATFPPDKSYCDNSSNLTCNSSSLEW